MNNQQDICDLGHLDLDTLDNITSGLLLCSMLCYFFCVQVPYESQLQQLNTVS